MCHLRSKKNLIMPLILLLFLTGCATANMNKLNILRKDSKQVHSLTDTLDYPKKDIFESAIKAIQNKSDAIVRYSDFGKGEIYAQTSLGTAFGTGLLLGAGGVSGSNMAIFLEGNNPTKIRIAQMNYGTNHEDYKSIVLREIKALLNQ